MTAPIILADLADLCDRLEIDARKLLVEAEALTATNPDRATALAFRYTGIHSAVTAVLAFIAARVVKETT